MDFDSYTHYVFDFDGTLFDTAPDVVHSLQKTLQHYGYATDAVNVSLLGQSWKNSGTLVPSKYGRRTIIHGTVFS